MSEKFYPPEDRDPTASPAPAPEAPSEDFDALLRSALPELPPQDVVREVTPLGGTVKLITWGLTLCSVTLNIGSLLPLLMRVSGTLLCLIGFRRLRRENGWFRACYGLSILRLALDWAGELRQTTLLRPPAALETAVLTVSVLALLALSFCLWRGLLAARRKAGQPPRATAAGALCLWYAVLFGVLSLAGGTITGWFVWLPLLLYLVLLWRLFRLGREMEDSRYVLDPAPVRLTDGKLALLLLTAAAILALCGYTFFNRLPMDWQPDTPVSQEAEAIRQELRDLNFPEEVLQDLSEETSWPAKAPPGSSSSRSWRTWTAAPWGWTATPATGGPSRRTGARAATTCSPPASRCSSRRRTGSSAGGSSTTSSGWSPGATPAPTASG